MEDQNQIEKLQPEQEEPAPDALIELRHTGAGIDIAVHAADNPMNPAIHFANWLGRNLQPLLMLAREDYNAAVDRRKAAKRLMEVPAVRLVGPDGSPLQ